MNKPSDANSAEAAAPDRSALRSIVHRGQAHADRYHFKHTRFRRVETTFPAGKSIGNSVADFMLQEGCSSGIIEFSGGWLSPFDYVIPAEDPAKKHAVWYSETRSSAGGAAFVRASCSVGLLHGKPFLHCHGLWRDSDGVLAGGHLLPEDNMIVEPVAVNAVLAVEGRFERLPDTETSFELFSVAGGGRGDGIIATVRPNTDITAAIEELARSAGIHEARIHGVGSLIDMSLADGQAASSLALEVAITNGRVVRDGDDIRVVDLAMAGVGMDGVPIAGPLARGRNRVCVTFELALDCGDQ